MPAERPILLPPRPWNWFMWVAATFLGVFLILSDLRQLDGLHLPEARLLIGRDFLNVWSGGTLALTGQLERLYDFQAYMDWQAGLFGPLEMLNYSYPPHSLFLAMPFALFPYPVALALWTGLGAIFFAWAARPYIPAGLSPWLALLTPAAIVNIWVGHYGFVIGGLWLLFFAQLRHAPVRAGLVAGLLTLKPHLGLLIALTLVHRRAFRAIGAALAVTLGLIGLSGLAFGFDLWPTWLTDTSALQTRIMTAEGEKFYFFMMTSAYVALREGPYWLPLMAQTLFAGSSLYLVWRARHCTVHQLAFITATATALITPYIFNYDLTVCCLGFAILLYGQWHALHRNERIILWMAFAAPLLVMAWNLIAPIALLAGLVVQIRCYTGMSYADLLLPEPLKRRLIDNPVPTS